VRAAPVLLAVAATVAAAGTAAAVSFARADSNHDGLVTYREARNTMPRLSAITFGKCDRDRDGLLDTGEFACLDGIYALRRLPDD